MQPNHDTTNNADVTDCMSDRWAPLLDSLPAEAHARYAAAKMVLDPAWRAVDEMEQAEEARLTAEGKADSLRHHVDGLNARGTSDASWGSLMTGAVAGFDVDMVEALLTAGARADHLYMDRDDSVWSIADLALFEYKHRAAMFEQAPALWAERCARIIALSVEAGGPRWVSVCLGPLVRPVLDLLRAQGIEMKGSESWREVAAELDIAEGDALDHGDLMCIVLEDQGIFPWQGNAFEFGEAQLRFEAAFGAWFDEVLEPQPLESEPE